MSEHYVEVHVNVDPGFVGDLITEPKVDAAAKSWHFRRGKLLMDKGREAPDAFFTLRGNNTAEAEALTRGFVREVGGLGVEVLRYKMEITLVDSREDDRWGLL